MLAYMMPSDSHEHHPPGGIIDSDQSSDSVAEEIAVARHPTTSPAFCPIRPPAGIGRERAGGGAADDRPPIDRRQEPAVATDRGSVAEVGNHHVLDVQIADDALRSDLAEEPDVPRVA